MTARCRIAATLALIALLLPLAASKSRAVDPAKQRDEQKKIYNGTLIKKEGQ